MIYQVDNSIRSSHQEICIWNNFSFRPHMHRDFELIYVLSGKLEIIVDEKSEIMEQYQTALIFPNQVHAFRNIDSAKVMVHVFSGDVVGEFNIISTNMIGERSIFESDKQIMEQYYNTIVTNGESGLYYSIGFLYLILGAYIKSIKLIPRNARSTNLLNIIFKYIDSHFKENITLSDVAKECKYSPHYLSKVFATNVHINFKRVVNTYRLEFARHLFNTTDMSITEIAMESGFGNIRSFNRAFFDEYGINPRQLRSQNNIDKSRDVTAIIIASPNKNDLYEK